MLDYAEISWVIFSFFSELLVSLRLILRKQHQKIKKKSLSSMALSPAALSPVLSPPPAPTPTPSLSPCSLPWPKVVVSPSAAPPASFTSKADLLRPMPEELLSLPRISSCGQDGPKIAGMIKRKRPARLLIPEMRPAPAGCDEFGEWEEEEKVVEAEGSGYYVVGKKGRRRVMEDGYGVITDVFGNPKQAFFGVFDGHGGRGAVDFVTEKLGRNILSATKDVKNGENGFTEAIRAGYQTTDKEFQSQGVGSGSCVATVLVENGNLHAANAGDCRVVLSRNGVAVPLTSDHRAERADERMRIENLGGYVDCINGIWRVQGSLAISRAIGDVHMKEWVTSEPEISKVALAADCEFLIMASDGLWDKVSNQEAVDEVIKNRSRTDSCRKLVEMSTCRGNKDDITIMVVDLQKFL